MALRPFPSAYAPLFSDHNYKEKEKLLVRECDCVALASFFIPSSLNLLCDEVNGKRRNGHKDDWPDH